MAEVKTKKPNAVKEALDKAKFPNLVKAYAWARMIVALRGDTIDASVLSTQQFEQLENAQKFNKFLVHGRLVCVLYSDDLTDDKQRVEYVCKTMAKVAQTPYLLLITPTPISAQKQQQWQRQCGSKVQLEWWPLERTTFDLRRMDGQPPSMGLVHADTPRMQKVQELGISKLPMMRLPNDPYARLLGAKVGDIVWMQREGEAEESYRRVCTHSPAGMTTTTAAKQTTLRVR